MITNYKLKLTSLLDQWPPYFPRYISTPRTECQKQIFKVSNPTGNFFQLIRISDPSFLSQYMYHVTQILRSMLFKLDKTKMGRKMCAN